MNVAELKAMLDEVADPENVEVMIAHQPSWPLAEVMNHVVLDSERDVHDDDSDELDEGEPIGERLWLVAGGHPEQGSPYAPRDVF